MHNRPVIVIPTNRSSENFTYFLSVWRTQFEGCTVIIVEDREDPIIDISSFNNLEIIQYSWKDIDKKLGKSSWIIPRKTDCVRSFGYYMAYKYFDPLFIITMDDDVRPVENINIIESHYNNLFSEYATSPEYYSTIKYQDPRGYIEGNAKCGISHGGWLNVPDLDANTFIAEGYKPYKPEDFNEGLIPFGATYSMCGMNLAWRPEITKYMYFGLQGENYPIDRCGDIWAGYYSKHKLDTVEKLNVFTGRPFVNHVKQSNSWSNLIKEKNSKELSKYFIKYFINEEKINTGNYAYDEYFKKLNTAYQVWKNMLE